MSNNRVRTGVWSTSFQGNPVVRQFILLQQSFLCSSGQATALPPPQNASALQPGEGRLEGTRHSGSKGAPSWEQDDVVKNGIPPPFPQLCCRRLRARLVPAQAEGWMSTEKLTLEKQAGTDLGSPQRNSRVLLQLRSQAPPGTQLPKSPSSLTLKYGQTG